MMAENPTILQTALDLIAEGISFIPLKARSKIPALSAWSEFQERIPSEKEARIWFADPNLNLGIICGKVSGNLFVLDFDTDEACRKFAADYATVVHGCPVVKTARGLHLYLRSDTPVASRKFDNIDLKSSGGYIVGPGSTHPSGAVYRLYRGDLSKIPTIDPEMIGLGPDSGDGNGAAKPEKSENWQDELLGGVSKGERNTTLTQLAGRYVQSRLSRQETLEILLSFAGKCTPPLSKKVVESTLDSVLKTHNRKKKKSDGLGIPVKDYGHAAVLAQHFKGRMRWAPHRGSWMAWDDKVWKSVEEEWVAKQAADTLRKEYAAQLNIVKDKDTIRSLLSLIRETCTYARIIAALSFLKGWDGILTRTEEWDADPWALNCMSGIIDLHAGHLSKHDPDRLITKLAPVDFDPEALGEVWQEHLKLFLPNEAVRRQVQRDLGIALVGTAIEEMLPIWLGSGSNGKTTTARALRKTVGDYLGEAAPNLLIQTKFERHPTELADLAGRRIVFSSEVGQRKRLDEEVVKRLTGGDVKKGRFMRGDFFDIEQTFTIFMIVNHRPGISGTDHAIWRRVRLIPWGVQIPDARKLPQDEVIEHLVAEGPAVLSWLLAGLADWQRDRGWMAPEVKAATAAYQAEQDRLGAFLLDRCEEAPQYTIPVAELYEAYTAWCQASGEDPLGKTAYGRRLKERGKISKREGHNNTTTWFGLRLRRTATLSTINPMENKLDPNKQVNNVAKCRKDEQIDTEKGIKQNDLDLKATPKKGEIRL